MKTLVLNTSGKRFALVLGAALTILSVDMIAPQMSQADLKVRARVRTPNVVIDVGNTGYHHGPRARPHHRYRRWNRPVRPHVTRYYVVTHHDRKVAKRLSYMTGWEKRVILRMKKEGYGWHAIANHLDFPNYYVSIAHDHRSFKRWKRHNEPVVCGVGGYYDD